MRRFFRDRRGSTAIMFALSAIPLIGLAGLGTEVGQWYAVKRHAQNAADASALAGAMTLVTGGSPSVASTRAGTVATADGFTDAAAPFTGAHQSVSFAQTPTSVTATISQTQPMLLAPVLCIGKSPCSLNSVTILAAATASIVPAQPVCMLALKHDDSEQHPALELNGNQTITGNSCSLMSNGHIKLSSSPGLPDGTSLFAAEGCKGPSCNIVGTHFNWYAPPPQNPLTRLDDRTQFQLATLPSVVQISNSAKNVVCPNKLNGQDNNTCTSPAVTGSLPNLTLPANTYADLTMSSGTPVTSLTLSTGTYTLNSMTLAGNTLTLSTGGTYSVNTVNVSAGTLLLPPGRYSTINVSGGTLTLPPGTYQNVTVSGGTLILSSGMYSFGNVNIAGGTVKDACAQYQDSCTSHGQNGENIVIETSLSVGSNATINLTARVDNTSLLNGVLIYYAHGTDASPDNVTFNGSNSKYGGALYFPHANLTWGGNSQSAMSCTEVIASTIQFSGNTNIDTTGCPDGQNGIVPKAQVVLLTN